MIKARGFYTTATQSGMVWYTFSILSTEAVDESTFHVLMIDQYCFISVTFATTRWLTMWLVVPMLIIDYVIHSVCIGMHSCWNILLFLIGSRLIKKHTGRPTVHAFIAEKSFVLPVACIYHHKFIRKYNLNVRNGTSAQTANQKEVSQLGEMLLLNGLRGH